MKNKGDLSWWDEILIDPFLLIAIPLYWTHKLYKRIERRFR